MVSIKGDFRKIREWQKALKTAPKALEVASKLMAEEAVELIRDGISEGQDPYGKKHKKLALRSGRPLQDSGRLKGSWFRKSSSARSFVVSSAVDYAVYHQEGTGIYGPKKTPIRPKKAKALRIPGVGVFASVKGTPKRMMVPDRRGLPPLWKSRLGAAAVEAIEAHFR